MKEFIEQIFDAGRCKREIDELGVFLNSKSELSERSEILPFFNTRRQLAAFLGTYAPVVGTANRIAYEFPIFGDFIADLVIGNKDREAYCLVELEDAGRDSLFTTVRGKSTKEWGRRFEHGFSQLVDWFHALDGLKSTPKFAQLFGHEHVRFEGILVIGRDAGLSESDCHRLTWRTEKVLVDSHNVHCLTFDGLHRELSWRISHYPEAEKLE